jgi:hypothetical protein
LDRWAVENCATGLFSVFLDGVLLEQDGDESGGGDGDEGSDDAGEGRSQEEGDEDGEAREVDAGTHDARDEEGVFDVDVDEVEDEDAGHLGPGVECGDEGGECDGDGAAGDGNDVEEAHEEAEQDEVADVEETEDDGARDAEDKHEGALADEPFAHLAFGSFEGLVEAVALVLGLICGDEGEKEAVGVFAFEHEIDAEEGGGEDVEEVREPERERGEEIAGGGVEGADGALGDGFNAEPVGEGNFFELVNDAGNALREVVGELAEVAEDRREAGGEEEREDGGDADDQKDDRHSAGRVVAAQVELRDASDGGHEDYGEEGADVEDQEFFFEGPGEGEKKEDRDAEEDVAADFGAGSLLVGGEVFGRGVGQLGSPWMTASMLTFGCK